MWLLQHRLAVALVAVAALATAGVFTFARPEYRPPNSGGELLTFPEAVPPAHGWRWDDPTPGFHLGEDGDRWNLALLKPREVPPGAGVLAASRTALHGMPDLIYSTRGCIGVQLTNGSRRALCPPHAEAVVIASVRAFPPAAGHGHSLFLTGIARSDVARVLVDTDGPLPQQVVYETNGAEWWGTFMSTTSPKREATVTVRDKRGGVARLRIRISHPGDALYCVAPSGPVSCR